MIRWIFPSADRIQGWLSVRLVLVDSIIRPQESLMKRFAPSLALVLITLVVNALGCSLLNITPDAPPDTETPLTQPAPVDVTGTPGLVLTDVPLPAGYGAQAPWIDIYFTDPESPLASQETGGPDVPLAASIDAARLTVDVAIYSLSLTSIRDALIHAHDRGIQVRVVMESDNLDASAPQALINAGIPVLGDRREGLMHDKFVVIDRSEVWLGSMNYTFSGAYEDNNDLVHIRSTKMAEDYTKEFEEMFLDDKFGPDVVPETPNPDFNIDDTRVEVLFSPDDGVASRVYDILTEAEKSIYFLAFSFTSDDLGQIIRTQAENGVDVAGVMDEGQVKSNVGTEYDLFKQAGLKVFVDSNEGLMHHKTIIVDDQIVITGSYNFTNSAETRNDENLIVLYNPTIANFYMQEFNRIYDQAQQ
jgi:phosphatidylserine/phosphatidylglycerophosphate/cardiolipin synthase-like enzyme